MKITPVAGRSAFGVATSTPSESTDPQLTRPDVRKISMKTLASPPTMAELQASVEAESAKTDEVAKTSEVIEETKPLSPQAAALAKQRRALQVKERELNDREKALETRTTGSSEDLIAQLKSQPLRVLQEHGVTYDQLTESLLADLSGVNPEIQKLRDELKAVKDGVDKNLSERDQQAETQVLREMRKEADGLAANGDDFELVREQRKIPDVINLIHRTYKESGEVLDVREAMQLVEDELLKDNLKLVSLKKIQSKLTPTQPQAPQQPKQNTIKTLTNRDTSSVPLSRKERALMAALGTLKRG